jgi:hypothetical protein
MKLMIFLGATVVGTLGSWLGAAMSGGNWLSGWSLVLGAAGSIAGIWVGYRVGQNLGV